ncbi:Uncharacterized protein Adt_20873 [Abeliophyllum distichum]|uniref:Transposase (putative) gypsy type domain-containing protein n=1 Tax=Abeliophyllum distichum TaxID=126358 RepID=A0ABD1SXT3_9LAMI
MKQGVRLPMHPFFCEVLKYWNLAPCQITPNGWGQMVASYLLWVVAEAGKNLTLREFESIYRPCRSLGWYNVSPRPGQKWRTATDSPNKVHNWKERFFFVGGDWEFILEDPLLHVSIPRRFGELDYGKPPIPKRNQAFRFKGVPVLRLAHPASGEGSSAQAPRQEASGPSQEAQDAAPSSVVSLLRSKVDANVPSRQPSSSNLHIDSTTSRDKGKKVVERAEEAPSQKRKAPAATEGLMHDARKARRTKEGRRSSPSLDGELEGPSNSVPSAGHNHRIRIFEHREELPASVMDMLPAHPSIVAVSVHRYWTSSWEKVAEEATVLEWLQLAEVNLVRGIVLAKDIFSTFASFDAEDSKSKKLAEDLKEAQKLVEDRTLAAETALAATNSSSKAVATDNERSLSAMRLELEKIKAERADAEVGAVDAYQDAFVDTPEYQDLEQYLMTVGGEQLVERIRPGYEWYSRHEKSHNIVEPDPVKDGVQDRLGRLFSSS